MSTPSTLIPAEDIDYPESDGQPVAENTLQFLWIVTIQGGLDALFRDNPDVFVAGDLLWYPVQGSNTIRTAPDALVAFGRPKGHRGSYMQWREDGIAPQVVWEVLSPGNRAGELDDKFEFYRRYGVEEYYQFDPDRGRLRGWLREGAQLREIVPIEGWTSPRLDVRLEMERGDLVIFRPDGQRFQTYLDLESNWQEAERARWEERRERLEAEARAEQERQRRKAAQTQAEQERQQRRAAQTQAEQERQRAEQADQRAEQERQQRQAAQAQAEQERQQREAAQTQAEQERQRAEHADQRAEHADQRAEQERQQREAAQAQAEQLAAKLRALGIDPEA
jgi:Uma2 family endonuclease